MLRPLALLTALVSLLAPGSPAAAHEYWLAPSISGGPAGAKWSVAGSVGTGFHGEVRPYVATRVVRFELRGGAQGKQGPITDLRPQAREGDSTWATGTLQGTGGALIAYQSNFAPIELPGPEFDAYLKLEGLEEVRRVRAARIETLEPGRERYRRACKTWIAGTKSDRGRAVKPVGMPLEILPQQVPGSTDRFAFTVSYLGKPLPAVLVRAWHHPAGAPRDSVGRSSEVRTDGKGYGVLLLAGPGEWLVSTVHMVPSADLQMADWESTWASYTFSR